MHHDTQRAAFTLIEISIVLVIIGLIVGGVLVGQELIQQATYRKQISTFGQIKTAVYTFRNKYYGYPGDISNATQFNLGFNGNGDRHTDGNGPESLYFWQHLSKASMIEGQYTGLWAPGVSVGVDEEVPPSSFGNEIGLWQKYQATTGGGGYENHYPVANYIGIGTAASPVGLYPTFVNTLLPSQVAEMDRKMDDGYPLSGQLLAWNYVPCVTGTEYLITGTLNYCWFHYRID